MGLTIKDDLSHAFNYGYPVRVTFKGCVRKGLITALSRNSFIMSVCNGARHNDSSVISVERVETSTPKDIRFVDEGEEAVSKCAKHIIRTANTNGQWVSILYDKNTRSISGSLHEVRLNSVKIGPNRVHIHYADIDEAYAFDPAGSTSPPEAGRWEVIHREKGHYRLESTQGKRIALSDAIPLETAKAMAGALQMRDALRAIQNEYASNDEKTKSNVLSQDVWRLIMAALNKAGG